MLYLEIMLICGSGGYVGLWMHIDRDGYRISPKKTSDSTFTA